MMCRKTRNSLSLFPLCIAFLGMTGSTCTRQTANKTPKTYAPGTAAEKKVEALWTVYDSGLADGWHDYGWAERDIDGGKPAHLKFTAGQGWIIAHPGDAIPAAGVTFQYKTDKPAADFLQVRLHLKDDESFPVVNVEPKHRHTKNGWEVVTLTADELNPNQAPFDRLRIYAVRDGGQTSIDIDKIALIGIEKGSKPSAESPIADAAAYAPRSFQVTCQDVLHEVNEKVFGIAYNPRFDDKEDVWDLNPSSRRWGGNPASRYNHRLGNAWNTAADWFFENVNYRDESNPQEPAWQKFLSDNGSHKVTSAVTLPLLGFVAKDTTSSSFPTSKVGKQQKTDEYRKGAGNGLNTKGKPIDPLPPSQTSLVSKPADWGDWVSQMRKFDDGKQHMYLLGNEPMLWHDTHRDVHPKPATYDEVLKKSIDAIVQIREKDADALIAGPALWGWTAYEYSARDSDVGTTLRPDRRQHGDIPFLRWYIRQLKKEGKKRGMRMLDVVDIHYYPQGDKIYSAAADATTAGKRIRSVRSLWDPDYKDESWIKEPVYLIPRMKKLIAEEDPSLQLSLGEWSFGGEEHMSGAIALAEAYGRMLEQELDYAYYWTYPKPQSMAAAAFRAFRDYDGKGGRFRGNMLRATQDSDTSIFAAQSGDKLVLIIVHKVKNAGVRARIDLKQCPSYENIRTFQLTPRAAQLQEFQGESKDWVAVAPYSVSVVEYSAKK